MAKSTIKVVSHDMSIVEKCAQKHRECRSEAIGLPSTIISFSFTLYAQMLFAHPETSSFRLVAQSYGKTLTSPLDSEQ